VAPDRTVRLLFREHHTSRLFNPPQDWTASHEVGGASRVSDVFATVAEATARCRRRQSSCGSLAFTARPPWPSRHWFDPLALTCEELPACARPGDRVDHGPSPRDLHLSLGDTFRLALSVTVPSGRLRARKLLASHPVRFRNPLLGLSKDRPPIDINTTRPLPVAAQSRGTALRLRHEGSQPSRAFRPCCSSQLRRFAPRSALQVCCTLLPIKGSPSCRCLYDLTSLGCPKTASTLSPDQPPRGFACHLTRSSLTRRSVT
jgi:hypothetical protein